MKNELFPILFGFGSLFDGKVDILRSFGPLITDDVSQPSLCKRTDC